SNSKRSVPSIVKHCTLSAALLKLCSALSMRIFSSSAQFGERNRTLSWTLPTHTPSMLNAASAISPLSRINQRSGPSNLLRRGIMPSWTSLSRTL
uniref:Uncharacterized protein n=1 Tax=Parascaris univalens TaxID=6257 RepID=A0A915BAF3_PARUN